LSHLLCLEDCLIHSGTYPKTRANRSKFRAHGVQILKLGFCQFLNQFRQFQWKPDLILVNSTEFINLGLDTSRHRRSPRSTRGGARHRVKAVTGNPGGCGSRRPCRAANPIGRQHLLLRFRPCFPATRCTQAVQPAAHTVTAHAAACCASSTVLVRPCATFPLPFLFRNPPAFPIPTPPLA
jgi:hypothetical protein